MNLRLTVASAAAVILAAVSLYPLIQGSSWFWAGAGAVIAAATAGIISRLPVQRAAVTGSVLALVAVVPMFLAPSWVLRVIAVVIVAIPAAGQLRQRMLQALGGLITYLATLLIYLNLAFAARLSFAAVIPSRASVAYLWSIAGNGLNARSLAPPVPGSPGLVLLAAGGIGLIAVATDLLAVRLRSPAMAGLPLLALYCVRITTSASQGGIGAALVFCLGMIGYLALLAVDGRERLRVWGRVVTVWGSSPSDIPTQADGVDTRALAASGRRIGLAAACIALVIPLVVPGVSVHDLLRSSSQGAGPGRSGSPITLPNPLVQMRAQLLASATQTVLTYRTTAANPPEQYLQIYVLNYNTASGAWTLGQLGRFSPAGSRTIGVPGLTPGTPTAHPKTKVTFSQAVTSGYGSRLSFLPVPYAPSTLQVSAGTWVEDNQALMVYSGGTSLSGLSYTVTSTEPSPRSAQLGAAGQYPANIANGYLGAPAGPNGQLANLAKQITAGAQTQYQKALKLQSYFTSGAFTYVLGADLPNSTDGLVRFLFTTKAGMCQQFAFAMATLARLVGIPARIAVGYTAGSRSRNGSWRVTTADAHAWPELYFTGVGWLRFEPTPGGANGQGTATVPQYAPGPVTSGPAGPTSLTPTGLSPGLLGGVGNIPGERRVTAVGDLHGRAVQQHSSLIEWILLAVAAFLIVVLTIPMLIRMLVRSRRSRTTGDAAAAHAAWRELRDNLADYGFGSPVSESPRAAARRITTAVQLDPAASQAVGRIVSAEERARYAPAPLSSGTLRADTAAFRRALSQDADWQVRLRALVLPRSVVSPARHAVQQALDVFGWMDAVGLRFRYPARQHQE